MAKQSAVAKLAYAIARKIIAEQTRVRVALSFDAALIAAHEVFGMGPGRAAAFANAYGEAMELLAGLIVSDRDENGDRQIEYAKGKRDELIRKIVGEQNFVPFDRAYGYAWMDELRRIRLMQEEGKA
jgi:hypothetical protein